MASPPFALGAIALAVARARRGIEKKHHHSSDVKSDHDDSIADTWPITHVDHQRGSPGDGLQPAAPRPLSRHIPTL